MLITEVGKTDSLKTSSLKNWSAGQLWGAPSYKKVIEFSNFLLPLKNQRSGSKICVAFIIIILKGIIAFQS